MFWILDFEIESSVNIKQVYNMAQTTLIGTKTTEAHPSQTTTKNKTKTSFMTIYAVHHIPTKLKEHTHTHTYTHTPWQSFSGQDTVSLLPRWWGPASACSAPWAASARTASASCSWSVPWPFGGSWTTGLPRGEKKPAQEMAQLLLNNCKSRRLYSLQSNQVVSTVTNSFF